MNFIRCSLSILLILTLGQNNPLCSIPSIATAFIFPPPPALLTCSLPEGVARYRTSTVSNGLIALRFYNGNDDSTNIEIPLPLANGMVIADQPGFDKTKKTLIYFFGFQENIHDTSVHRIINAYIAHGGYNIFVVDWSSISCQGYLRAVSGCNYQVPTPVAVAINQMIQSGLSKNLIEVVGHSLGAQCAGKMGRDHFSGSLPSIVGLDPAGPGFTCLNGLHRGDASFVQIIHTDRGFFGTLFHCGDFDIMLNRDGHRFQPGCKCIFPPFTFRSEIEICSHSLSWEVYASSVRGSAQFLCANCNHYLDFKINNCNNNLLVALYGADVRSRGNCYLITSGQNPFGLGAAGAHY